MSTTRIYVTESKSRGDSEMGPVSLTYTDVLTENEDGTLSVISNVKGDQDGEWVNATSTRQYEGPVDWDRIDAARRSQQWRRVDA